METNEEDCMILGKETEDEAAMEECLKRLWTEPTGAQELQLDSTPSSYKQIELSWD